MKHNRIEGILVYQIRKRGQSATTKGSEIELPEVYQIRKRGQSATRRKVIRC